MKAYKNDATLRSKFLAELEWHQEQDKFIQGNYAKGSNGDFRGCAVGCANHSLAKVLGVSVSPGNHQALEDLLEWPVELAHLIDGIFESLPIEKAKLFPLQVGQAIRVGADLKMVVPQFIYWMLQDAPAPKNEPPAFTKYWEAIVAIYEKWIKDGAKPPQDSDRADRADRAYRAYRADLADLAYRADRADLADRAYRADLADLAYRADRADLADLAYRADRADLADLAYRADRADLADLADLAYRADRADLAAEKLLELLRAA